MSDQQSSYRQVFKATSIFGGVQVFVIAIGLIRTKFVALFIGPEGYGINSLLNAPLGLIGTLTALGIAYSAIRNLAEANGSGDMVRFSKTVVTFRRWMWVTGLLGMSVTIILSPFLSQSGFGNYDYTWAFIAISVTFLIGAISSGQSSLLYATRRIKDTSRSPVIGGALGLVTSVPLYYYYGIKGIVPAMIIASLTTLIISWNFARRVPLVPVKVTYRESFEEGKSFAKVGFAMTANGLMGNGVTYAISSFISHIGGVAQVGLYNSGWSITERYVSMVFAAMGADYYPRLAAINKDNAKVNEAVNQQAEMGVLIMAPIILFYLASLPILIPILYTDSFMAVIPFTQWVVIGMLLKVIGWSLGFIALAKGESKLYFKLEVFATIVNTLGIMVGYYFLGLEGVGIAFIVTYMVYVIYMYLFYHRRFHILFSQSLISVFAVQQSLCVIAFLAVKFLPLSFGYTIGIIALLLSSLFSLRELNKRIDIKGLWISFIMKRGR